MNEIAAIVGEHAVLALLISAMAVSLLTAAIWRFIQRFGGALWDGIARLWQLFLQSALADRARQVPMLKSSFSRTLTAWRFLGIHAIASFAIAFAAGAAFVELADEIGVEEEVAIFDAYLVASLGQHVDAGTLQIFATITRLGDRNLLLGIGVAGGAYFLMRRWWLHLVTWVLATGVGGILVRLLKAHFERTRPIHEHALTDSSGWSFPSGHAAGAVLVYGMLGYLIVRHTPSVWHVPIALASVLLVVFVGFSRVILQVHYFSDVLAGFTIAAAWLALCVAGFEIVRRRANRSR